MSTIYIPFNISILKTLKDALEFDVYVRLGKEKFLLLMRKGSRIDQERLDLYISKGITCLYIDNNSKDVFTAVFKEKAVFEEVPDKSAEVENLEKKIEEIGSENIKEIEEKTEALTERCINDLFYGVEINTEHIRNTTRLVKNYMSLLVLAPKNISELLNSIDENHYFHYHSVSVSITSIFLSRILSPDNERIQSITGMGGFLHDIGKAGSGEHDLNPVLKPKIISTEAYVKHPERGLKLLSSVENVPEEVKIIVYQHHERPDGTGFPNSLFNVKLYYPSRVVAVANAISKMVAKHPFGKEMKPKDAISELLASKGAFDSKVLQALAKVYNIR
ncbi:MAG: HD domain-containing protein [Oligoflexia bacterium]|nr:HD domain-containing protein [Oligoflexia bacterium]